MFSGVHANLIHGLIGVPTELEPATSKKLERETTTRKTTTKFEESIAKDF
jgi:hypothetical protein